VAVDSDPGDEADNKPFPHWKFVQHRIGGCWVGMHPSLIHIWPPDEDHDGGDEDDFHNYIPSTGRTGLPLWDPREGPPPNGLDSWWAADRE